MNCISLIVEMTSCSVTNAKSWNYSLGKSFCSQCLYILLNETQRRLSSPYYTLKTEVLVAQLVKAVRTDAMCKKFVNFQTWISVLKWKLCTRNKHNSVVPVNVCHQFTYHLQTLNSQCYDSYIIDLTKSLLPVIMISKLWNRQELESNTF